MKYNSLKYVNDRESNFLLIGPLLIHGRCIRLLVQMILITIKLFAARVNIGSKVSTSIFLNMYRCLCQLNWLLLVPLWLCCPLWNSNCTVSCERCIYLFTEIDGGEVLLQVLFPTSSAPAKQGGFLRTNIYLTWTLHLRWRYGPVCVYVCLAPRPRRPHARRTLLY